MQKQKIRRFAALLLILSAVIGAWGCKDASSAAGSSTSSFDADTDLTETSAGAAAIDTAGNTEKNTELVCGKYAFRIPESWTVKTEGTGDAMSIQPDADDPLCMIHAVTTVAEYGSTSALQQDAASFLQQHFGIESRSVQLVERTSLGEARNALRAVFASEKGISGEAALLFTEAGDAGLLTGFLLTYTGNCSEEIAGRYHAMLEGLKLRQRNDFDEASNASEELLMLRYYVPQNWAEGRQDQAISRYYYPTLDEDVSCMGFVTIDYDTGFSGDRDMLIENRESYAAGLLGRSADDIRFGSYSAAQYAGADAVNMDFDCTQEGAAISGHMSVLQFEQDGQSYIAVFLLMYDCTYVYSMQEDFEKVLNSIAIDGEADSAGCRETLDRYHRENAELLPEMFSEDEVKTVALEEIRYQVPEEWEAVSYEGADTYGGMTWYLQCASGPTELDNAYVLEMGEDVAHQLTDNLESADVWHSDTVQTGAADALEVTVEEGMISGEACREKILYFIYNGRYYHFIFQAFDPYIDVDSIWTQFRDTIQPY
jgi:hypothetical protein